MEPDAPDDASPKITRRTALTLGAVGVGGLSVALAAGAPGPIGALFRTGVASASTPPPPPQVIASANGVLQGTLRVTESPAWIAGDPASGMLTYNGLYPGPVLRARPGDRVLLDLVNESTQVLNTHFHGFHVTPEGAGDNVFARVTPGQTFKHDFVIPADHPGGLYWYHPHVHGVVDKELYGGLAGLFVIEGGAASLPALAGATSVLMALKNSSISGTAPNRTLAPEPASSAQIHLVNGQLSPTFTMRPGETQLWQVANTGNDAYYRIGLESHTFTVLAEDGALLWTTYTATELLLPPGKRYEFAVTAGPAGTYAFRQLGYTQGPFGQWPAVTLASVTVAGTAATPAVLPTNPAPRDDLSSDPIAARRAIVMSESFDAQSKTPFFYMNGVLFQNITAGDIIQTTLGTTEEWLLLNDPSLAAGGTAEDHPFHIHVNPMVVTGRGTWDPITTRILTYQAVDAPGTSDTINVPAGEYVVMRMRFADYLGASVFHCHITFHEDMGMMGEFVVNPPPPAPPAAPTVTPTFTG